MELFVFVVAGAMVLGGAFGVVVSKHPVHAALSLILTLFGVAVNFVALQANFLAAVQVIVYAGAIVVLFLFVIMLLDLGEEDRRKLNRVAVGAGSVAVLGLAGVLVRALLAARPVVPAGTVLAEGNTAPLGRILFQSYLLPFEILSVLLLVAMVGVILLSKKELK